MDAVASHLAEIGTQDWFVLVRVQVSDGSALMLYECYVRRSPRLIGTPMSRIFSGRS